jgi:CBS domain containing-hemolysin-like protein
VAGLVTVEDVVEQIVGEITDEFDVPEDSPRAPAGDIVELDLEGATSIRDLSSIYGIELPANAGFETLAGYLLFRLGHIPAAGESVEFQNRRFEVLQLDRNRISQVRITQIPQPELATEPSPS